MLSAESDDGFPGVQCGVGIAAKQVAAVVVFRIIRSTSGRSGLCWGSGRGTATCLCGLG